MQNSLKEERKREMTDILLKLRDYRRKDGEEVDSPVESMDINEQIGYVIKPGNDIKLDGRNMSAKIDMNNYSPQEVALIMEFMQLYVQMIDSSDLNNDDTSFFKDIVEVIIDQPQARTTYPEVYITPTDKVTNTLFSGKLVEGINQLAMEPKGSKKEITTVVSIDFDNLDKTVQMRGKQELNGYDRQVHDAILTLNIIGKNEFITPGMIYQVITGDKKATLKEKQLEAINQSIDNCIRTRIKINASQEAEKYGFKEFMHEGSLINANRITAILNGQTIECIRLLELPILYNYAIKKNQIQHIPMALLNTPVNKNEEMLIIQGYLYRRILTMKNRSMISRNILFDTIFNQIKIDLKSKATGYEKVKLSRYRKYILEILDFWKINDFIKAFEYNKKGGVYYSITIDV